MSRRALGGWMLVVLGVALLWAGFSWWRSWSAPLVPVVFRPSFSVEGVASGTPVRVQGVVVGQVSSIGLEPDDQGRLRPLVSLSLDPSAMEDRGFADRLRGPRLRLEVQRGLRARLVAVNPSSGLLQVELIWTEEAPAPLAADLRADEVPAHAGGLQRRLEGFVQDAERLARSDLVAQAAEWERALDRWFPATDPARAAVFSAELVRRTAAAARATEPAALEPTIRDTAAACARLRAAVERADRRLDDESLVAMQARLAEAGAALASLGAALEASRAELDAAAGDFSGTMRAISEGARGWTKKAAGLTTEPLPR